MSGANYLGCNNALAERVARAAELTGIESPGARRADRKLPVLAGPSRVSTNTSNLLIWHTKKRKSSSEIRKLLTTEFTRNTAK